MAETSQAKKKGDLPRGFFRPVVLKNRHDPEVQKRKIPELDDEA